MTRHHSSVHFHGRVSKEVDTVHSTVLGHGEASCRQDVGSSLAKYEHLYQREVDQAAIFAEEVESFLSLNNEVRPHEAAGQRAPLSRRRGDHTYFRALSLQLP